MPTYAAVAKYEGSLAQAMSKLDPAFAPFPIGRPDVGKFTFTKQESGESYFIMISQGVDPRANLPSIPYNVILTITGPRKEKTNDLASRLAGDLKLNLMPAPAQLQRHAESMDALISMLKGSNILT